MTTFHFAGGGFESLAATLAKEVHEPVVLGAALRTELKPFDIEYNDSRRLVQPISRKVSSFTPDTREWSYCELELPQSLVFSPIESGGFIDSGQGTLEIDDGRVTTSSGGCEISLSQIGDIKWSKPIKMHWFIKKLRIALSTKGEREATVLKLIALACGADFYDTPKYYQLDFSPAAYRKQAINTFSAFGSRDEFPVRRETLTFAIEAFSLLTDEQLYDVFKTPDGSVTIPISKSNPAYQYSINRLNRLFKPEIEGADRSKHIDSYNWIKSKVDFDSPGLIEFVPMRIPRTKLRVKGEPNAWFTF